MRTRCIGVMPPQIAHGIKVAMFKCVIEPRVGRQHRFQVGACGLGLAHPVDATSPSN